MNIRILRQSIYIKSACIIARKKFWTKNSQPFVCVRSRCFTYDIVHEQEIDMEFVLNCVLTINRIKFALTLIFNRTPLCGSKELVKWLKLPGLCLFLPQGIEYTALSQWHLWRLLYWYTKKSISEQKNNKLHLWNICVVWQTCLIVKGLYIFILYLRHLCVESWRWKHSRIKVALPINSLVS